MRNDVPTDHPRNLSILRDPHLLHPSARGVPTAVFESRRRETARTPHPDATSRLHTFRMHSACFGSRATRAFTLVELLVVIGLIVTLVGGAAVALGGRGGEGAALTNAQSIVAGLVGATRAQAALHQTEARLIIYAQMPPAANADAAKYLRALQVVRQETLASGVTVWVAAGDPVTLPTPICVVPPGPVPANHLRLPAGQTWNNNVATGPVSTLEVGNGFSYRGQSAATANQFFGVNGQSGRILFLRFAPDGTVSSSVPGGNPTKIALSTAILGGNTLPLFNNTNSVRGLFVRKTGAVSLVNLATGF